MICGGFGNLDLRFLGIILKDFMIKQKQYENKRLPYHMIHINISYMIFFTGVSLKQNSNV